MSGVTGAEMHHSRPMTGSQTVRHDVCPGWWRRTRLWRQLSVRQWVGRPVDAHEEKGEVCVVGMKKGLDPSME
jgi:hypothetical protein